MADFDIVLARSAGATPLLPMERSSAPLARAKRRQLYQITLDATVCPDVSTSAEPVLHFVYAPIWKNGREVAKRSPQATDEYWSRLIDHKA